MTKTELTKHEKALLLFYLKGTLSDLSKALMFFLIFYVLGLHKEFLWGMFFLVAFRVYSGGIHCKTYWGCLLLSFVILSSGIFMGKYVFLPKCIATILICICELLTINYTPVQASSRPILTEKEIRYSKISEGVIVTSFGVLFIILPTTPYINIGLWLLAIHTIQLKISYIRR